MLDRALDEFAVELARFRAELIALMPPAATNGAGSEGADDFAEQHLIDPGECSRDWLDSEQIRPPKDPARGRW